MKFINEVDIKMINDSWVSGGYFNDWWKDNWYTVVDKQHFGERIGREIVDKIGEKIKDNESITGYDDNTIMEYVEEEFINNLRDEICEFIREYLDNNL